MFAALFRFVGRQVFDLIKQEEDEAKVRREAAITIRRAVASFIANDIKVEIHGLRETQRRIGRIPARLDRELNHAIQRSVLIAEGNIKSRTPVLTGTLRRSIHGEVRSSLHGVVGTPLLYGNYIETGVRRDPRARRGLVRRRAGGAHMHARGLEASLPAIRREFEAAVDRALRG